MVGSLGEERFEVGKEGGVVESPFGSFLASLVNVATSCIGLDETLLHSTNPSQATSW